MVEQYLETKENVQAPDDLESKRESLSILASLGKRVSGCWNEFGWYQETLDQGCWKILFTISNYIR